VKIFAFSLLSSEEVDSEHTILIDSVRTNTFTQDVDPERLSQIEVKKIGLPDEELMNIDKYMETQLISPVFMVQMNRLNKWLCFHLCRIITTLGLHYYAMVKIGKSAIKSLHWQTPMLWCHLK
jgi:hypothetical protein